jgi:hypothetical protein
MSGPYYLGRVKRAPQASDGYRFASVEPLIESSPSGSEWLSHVGDAVSRFPNRGLVHWHDAPTGLREGSLWQFAVDDHPFTERADRPEQYQLRDAQEAIEVLDLRSWEDEAALRSTVTAEGLPLTSAPIARRVLLWLASGLCVGPLLLKRGTAPGLWVLDAPEAHRDAARMPVWHLAATDINRVPLEGSRWFVGPGVELDRSGGIQNWTSDAHVARSVLGRLRKMDPDLVKALGVTDNLFRDYLHHVENGRMGGVDPAVERARADRLSGFRNAIQRDVALLTEAAEALLATEAVRMEVERQVQSKVAEEVRARQSEIDVALAEKTEQLTRLQVKLDASELKSTSLDTALLEKQRDLEQKVGSFEREVASRLEEIARRPEAIFAEAAVMRAILAPVTGGHGLGPAHAPARRGAGAFQHFGESSPQLADDAAVRRALAAHAGAGALSLHAILGVHAAFVAGTVPVIVGTRGYDVLRAYASAMAGGRLHWIPTGSSTMEPQDVLGRFESTSARIVPSPSGLLDVVNDATRSGRLHVVVFEGFNRAPTEAYLSPILEAARATRAGDAVRAIPLASLALLAEDDPYRQLARLAWPINVLIACLPIDGSAILPVPESLWRFLALLDGDDRDRKPMPSIPRGGAAPPSTEISPARWNDNVAGSERCVARDDDQFVALARALSLSARDAGDAGRLREVLSRNGLPDADATALAVSATLVPRSNAEAKVIEDAMRVVDAPGWRTMLAEAQRLRN